ncbi:hypothetical protein C2G38_2042097 [Gigaspora rosea]|uniref:Histidine kinase domain-containing protein n=1 Tax=Gigaspora rosea TaxID=44941 RepID=A0A397UQN0_9GLOM|nr:hypothetical protein C2G38_2042097 [Gigaspora rosea]
MIVFEVSDTGVGIPEVAHPNIFQCFFRVESQNSRSHEGSGISLALVKQLIICYEGDITVISVAKNNMPKAQFDRDQLSVDVDWSVGKVSTKEISSPSSTDNFVARKEHQILLIEDNDDMR